MTITAADTGLAQALATLAKWPDPDAWSLVLERVGEAMENLARRLAGDSELARDAVQEALLQIRDHAGSFRAPESEPDRAARSWILRVTAHTAITLQRKKMRRQRHEGHVLRRFEASSVSAEHRLTTSETAELIRTHLAELPEPTRAAIILHHCEGMGFSDVANALGVPEGTAKIRVHRGLAVLRQRLARVGFAGLVLLLSSALEKLPAAETTTAPFATTTLARGLLYKRTTSSLPFINQKITMTLVATISSIAAILLVGGVGIILSQNPAVPKSDVTTTPAVQARDNVPPTRDPAEIQPQPLEAGNPNAWAALNYLAPAPSEQESGTWNQRLDRTENRGFDLVIDLSKVGKKNCSLVSEVDWQTTLDALAKDGKQIWRMRKMRAEFIDESLAKRLHTPLIGRDAPSGTRTQILAWFAEQTNFKFTLHTSLGPDDGALLRWAQRSATTEEWINGLALTLKSTALLGSDGAVLIYRRPGTAPIEEVVTPLSGVIVYQDPPTACLNQEVTVDFKETEIRDVTEFLSQVVGCPIEVDTKLTSKLPLINLRLEEVRLRDVLSFIAKFTNTDFKVLPDRIQFTGEQAPADTNKVPPLP